MQGKAGQKTFLTSAAAVFLLAFLLRLALALPGLTQDEERFHRPDTASYLVPANSLYYTGAYLDEEGEPTGYRTPGLPVLLAALKPAAGNSTGLYSFLLLLIGSLTVFPVYGACRLYSSRGASAFAAALFAVNPTAIAHAPLVLSDTLFTLFAAFTLYFFLRFMKDRDPFFFFSAVFCAGTGTLVRPVNLLWLAPCLTALFLMRDQTWKRKLILGGGAVLLSALLLVPWCIRNYKIGEGFRLDCGSMTTLRHNASTLESSLTGESAETIRERYREEFAALPWLYPTKAEQNSVIEKKMMQYILSHPVQYIRLSLRPYDYLPDIATLMENLNITRTGQGTFDVLTRHGAAAAAEHYFRSQNMLTVFLIALPFSLAALTLYLCTAIGFCRCLFRRKRDYCLLFLLFGFGFYYTLMTGPVQMPRYILPALPVFCLFASMVRGTSGEKQ